MRDGQSAGGDDKRPLYRLIKSAMAADTALGLGLAAVAVPLFGVPEVAVAGGLIAIAGGIGWWWASRKLAALEDGGRNRSAGR